MKRSRFSEQQIAFALQQAEEGTSMMMLIPLEQSTDS